MATDARGAWTGVRRCRLDARQYVTMIREGILPPDGRVELLGGHLVEQMTKYTPHNFSARQVSLWFKDNLPRIWIVSDEKSLELGRFWRPEPDVAVIRGPNDRYRAHDPRAEDVGILVEVSDSTYATDRGVKWRCYAACRIAIYWIVNLQQRQIEIYRDPAGRGKKAAYRSVETIGPGGEVAVVIDGREIGRIAVDDILP